MDPNNTTTSGGRTSNVSYFQGASNFIINNGVFTTVAGNTAISSGYHRYSDHDQEWLSLLRNNTASGAFHDSGDSYDTPKCHPHTREAVLREIMDWVTSAGKVKNTNKFLWVYGPVGSGKSSIARKIAEMCKEQGLLASDYFFSRTSPDRNNSTNLIPTLAYQLVTFNPRIRNYVADIISLDTLIFSRSLEAQLEALVVRPFAQLMQSYDTTGNQPCPYLVIIDGLDECGPPESQKYILSSLSSALHKTPLSLIFLIISRPELIIRDTFNGGLNSHTRRIVLDNKYQPDKDIRLFLDSKFTEIKREHMLAPTLPFDWPGSRLDQLVRAASGQFIYASTVMKFIESPRERPTERLNMILNLVPLGNSTPFSDLDLVYKNILLSVEKPKLESALTVFAFIFASSQMKFTPYISSFDASELQTTAFMELFLGYEPYELLLILGDLHSVVDVPPISAPSNLAEIRLFHPSFGDFLQDRSRAGPDLFIDIGKYCVDFARLCIKHLTPWLYAEDANFPSSSAMIQYAFRLFLQLFSTAYSDDDLIHDLSQFPIDRFIKHMFDGWLPVFSLIPLLFDWIKNENMELYNRYTGHYNDYIRSRLLTESTPIEPRWQFIYTAVTLGVSNSADFSTICKLFVAGTDPDHEQATIIQKHLFGELNFLIESLDITDYLLRLKEIIVNPDQSGKYHVDDSKYCELAMELFDMFTSGKCPNILDDLSWGDQKVITNLFYASLDRIPKNRTLARHLHDNRHRDYVSFLKFGGASMRSRVDMYIQNCNNLPVEDLQASRPMFFPNVDYLSAPPPHLNAAPRAPSPNASSQEDPNRRRSISPMPVGTATPENHQPSSDQSQGPIGSTASRRGLRKKGKDLLNKIFH